MILNSFLSKRFALFWSGPDIKEGLPPFNPQKNLVERGKAGTRGGSPEGNSSGKKAKKICKA